MDDIVLLAEEEDEMRSMMGRLEGYLGRKGLELNTGKTKIMRFRKGGGRMGKIKWLWRGRGNGIPVLGVCAIKEWRAGGAL